MIKKSILSCALALLVASAAMPARALTGSDILDKMNSDERDGYLAGALEMAAFLSAVQGNKTRADCIMGWYYDRKEGANQIVAGLSQYKDHQALPVIYLLIKKACGA